MEKTPKSKQKLHYQQVLQVSVGCVQSLLSLSVNPEYHRAQEASLLCIPLSFYNKGTSETVPI